MPLSAFTAANLSFLLRPNQVGYIAHDEEGHVLYLEAGLIAVGAQASGCCCLQLLVPDDYSKPIYSACF
jgi:hypothetical protein